MGSLWTATAELPSFPRLEREISADVLIIGGGMAGLLTAYLLSQRGVSCVLLEKDRICSGVTANTTAKITFQHGFIYQKLIREGGVELASEYLGANRTAFEKYAELCRDIDCDYEIRDNYVYSTSSKIALEDEMDSLRHIGFNAELCTDLPLPFGTVGAVKFADQAQLHPLKFAAALCRKLNIYEQSFVREMQGNTAVTDLGKVRAEHVVVATHFPFINKHGSYFLKLYQYRSYVIALKNAADMNGMYIDGSGMGLSFRNYGDLLLMGGGGHRTGCDGGNWNELRLCAKRYYPAAEEKYHWATQDCMSLDHMPYIGHYSRNTRNLYTATGFNKWGMTGSMLSAMLLSDLISGKKNQFAHTFSPSRSILKPQLLVNGFEAAKNLLTFSQKRCPHLGCALKWNRAEHSWDCPCHGSRFDPEGRVLDNPANGDMKK